MTALSPVTLGPVLEEGASFQFQKEEAKALRC